MKSSNKKVPNYETDIFTVCKNGDCSMFQFLVNDGANIRKRDHAESNTCLHFASQGGNMNIVEYLVDYGLDINERNRYNDLPIHHASMNGRLEVIKYFVSLGVDIHTKNVGRWSCVHFASEKGKLEVVKGNWVLM